MLVLGFSCAIPPNYDPETELPPCDPGTYDAGIYDTGEGSWQRVNIPNELRGFTNAGPFGALADALGATSDGRAVLALGDYFAPQYWTVELDTGTWSRLPDPPGERYSACVSDDQLVVLSTKFKNGEALLDRDPHLDPTVRVFSSFPGDGHVLPSLAILDLTGRASWRETPAEEGVNFGDSPPNLTCLDHAEALSDGTFGPGTMRIYTEATGAWSTPAAAPGLRPFLLGRVWTGADLVFLPTGADAGTPAFAYRVADDCWRTLEGLPPVTRSALWTGSAIVGYTEPPRSGSGASFAPEPYHYELPNTPCLPADGGAALPQASSALPVAATPRFTE